MEATLDYSDYAKRMRAALSSPDMVRKDLSFNHQYFNTKKGHYWSDRDNQALARGIKKHGIGQWRKISDDEFQGKKYEAELQLRTCLLLSIQDLTDLMGKQIDVNDFDKNMVSQVRKKLKRM